jgi:hypothetical protein
MADLTNADKAACLSNISFNNVSRPSLHERNEFELSV